MIVVVNVGDLIGIGIGVIALIVAGMWYLVERFKKK